MILIDPPSPFAPREEWLEFRREMEELLTRHPDSEAIKEALREADQAIG